MKKSSMKKICAALVMVAAIAILFAIILPKPEPAPIPTFNFLSGRPLIFQYEIDGASLKLFYYTYSFEADFSDVIADANSEFSDLGYSGGNLNVDANEITCLVSGRKPKDEIIVCFYKNLKKELFSTNSRSGRFKDPPVSVLRNGWVTVEVIERKKKNRLIVMFKNLLNKFREPAE